jgi:NDP-sugar pyrophosphorylase family protein
MKRRFKTAFVLGAGLGKRLRPYTDSLPKPLIPLWGRPLLCHILDRLLRFGFERFIVNTHHAESEYKRVFPDSQWMGRPLFFKHEELLLDTGGGLKNIEDLLFDESAILCHNGDILTTMPYDRVIEYHNAQRPYFTLALRSDGSERHVAIDDEGNVVDIRDMLKSGKEKKFQFTGIYAVETECLRYIEANKPISLVDILLRFIKEKPGSVKGIVVDDGKWFELGTLESYERMKKMDPKEFSE